MRLSANAQSSTPAVNAPSFSCCPYPALRRWLPDEVLAGIIGVSGSARAWRQWPMALVLWGIVLQAFAPRRSQAECVQLLGRCLGRAVSAFSGSFCKARLKLSPQVPRLAAQWVGREAAGQACPVAAAHGRRVVQWDGSGCSLTDRPANQAVYPQPPGQQPGVGYPQVRFVAVREAASGVLLELSWGNLNDHDAKLARPLWDQTRRGDIVVADRGFASYGLFSGLSRRGVGLVVRQHQRRKLPDELVGDLDEQWVSWTLPRANQRGEFWDAIQPTAVLVRVVRYRLADGTVVVLNTNLGEEFSAADIRDLYEGRWQEEVSFRDLKRTLGLDPLAACTPQLAQTLVWGHVLAYNLARAVMVDTAAAQQVPLERLSLKHTLTALEFSLWAVGQPAEEARISLQRQVGAFHLPDRRSRPGQPRRVRRRRKQYPLMTQPRSAYPAREKPV